MGKSITPKYRVEYRDQGGWHAECWAGRATSERLEAWRKSRNQSFNHGGVNYPTAVAIGYIPHISHAKLVRQSNALVVADVKAPMFEVV